MVKNWREWGDDEVKRMLGFATDQQTSMAPKIAGQLDRRIAQLVSSTGSSRNCQHGLKAQVVDVVDDAEVCWPARQTHRPAARAGR
jgi:hypothetical protein